jgi:hypothetical protein
MTPFPTKFATALRAFFGELSVSLHDAARP